MLTHSGGIPPYRTRESLRWMLTLKGTPSEQRYALVERVLTEPPRFEPGTRHGLECWWGDCRRDGRANRRFPVSATRPAAGVRPPRRPRGVWQSWTRGQPQPWGHSQTVLGTVTEVTPAHAVYTTPLAIEPAGDASPSMQDYGAFSNSIAWSERPRYVLKATTVQALQGRVELNNPARGSAMGWSVMPRDGVESHEQSAARRIRRLCDHSALTRYCRRRLHQCRWRPGFEGRRREDSDGMATRVSTAGKSD